MVQGFDVLFPKRQSEFNEVKRYPEREKKVNSITVGVLTKFNPSQTDSNSSKKVGKDVSMFNIQKYGKIIT